MRSTRYTEAPMNAERRRGLRAGAGRAGIGDEDGVWLRKSEALWFLNAADELDYLRIAIETHRKNTTGHASCWENDVDLWRAVDPNAMYPHDEQPSRAEFLAACERYCDGRAHLRAAGIETGGDHDG